MIVGMDTHDTEPTPVNGSAVAVDTTPVFERPRWSASEAAKRCGVGRATIQRALDAGKLPGAVKGENGWEIPLEDLLAAGFKVDRPTPPDGEDEDDRDDDRSPDLELPEHVKALVDLQVELAETRAQVEIERVRREAAEEIATRVSAEKDKVISTQAAMLRMLEAAKPQAESAPEPAPEPIRPIPVQFDAQPKQGWFRRNFG